MQQVMIEELEIYRKRAIKVTNNLVEIVVEFYDVEEERWDDIEHKLIYKDEYEALKKLFEGGKNDGSITF